MKATTHDSRTTLKVNADAVAEGRRYFFALRAAGFRTTLQQFVADAMKLAAARGLVGYSRDGQPQFLSPAQRETLDRLSEPSAPDSGASDGGATDGEQREALHAS